MTYSLVINEVGGEGYQDRTLKNVQSADLTIALAINFNSGGEKLTRRLAGNKYLALPLFNSERETAVKLFKRCRDDNVKSLNIAGNGLYTLKRGDGGWTQDKINQYVYDVISLVHTHHKIDFMVSGGQTGVDLAGAVAAKALGIPFTLNMPEKLKQRNGDGFDVYNTKEQILRQVDIGESKIVKNNLIENNKNEVNEVVKKRNKYKP